LLRDCRVRVYLVSTRVARARLAFALVDFRFVGGAGLSPLPRDTRIPFRGVTGQFLPEMLVGLVYAPVGKRDR